MLVAALDRHELQRGRRGAQLGEHAREQHERVCAILVDLHAAVPSEEPPDAENERRRSGIRLHCSVARERKRRCRLPAAGAADAHRAPLLRVEVDQRRSAELERRNVEALRASEPRLFVHRKEALERGHRHGALTLERRIKQREGSCNADSVVRAQRRVRRF